MLSKSWYRALEEVQKLANDSTPVEIVEDKINKKGIYCDPWEKKVYIGTEIADSEFYGMQIYVLAHELSHIKEGLVARILQLYFPILKKKYEKKANTFAKKILLKKYGLPTALEIYKNIIYEFYIKDINDSKKKFDKSLEKRGFNPEIFNFYQYLQLLPLENEFDEKKLR